MLRRRSIRLKGHDYSQPGDYFVTICTRDRACILGGIVEGKMKLSEMGKIVESCWREIREHFENTRVTTYQLMPNHVHGIVEIRAHTNPFGRAVSPQGFMGEEFGKPRHGSLSTIVRSFKSAVTKQIHDNGMCRGQTPWQPRFFDHIIRSDRDHFFVQQYVELNPLLWDLDRDNPAVCEPPIDDLRRTLKERYGLEKSAVAYLIDYETSYRAWRQTETERHGLPIDVPSIVDSLHE